MITIVDYNAGNIPSVKRALDYLNIPCRISGNPTDVENAQRILFPGVGNAASAMARLVSSGLGMALRHAYAAGTPILGICLGCQIILSHSEEGDTPCLGLISGGVKLLPGGHGLKIPHMGWNNITQRKQHPVLKGIDDAGTFYFVHSYYTQPGSEDDIIATTEHGITFPVVIGHANLIATQFHPEKSGETGLAILKNFYEWTDFPC